MKYIQQQDIVMKLFICMKRKGLFKVENPLEGDEDEFIDVISMPIDEAY